MSVVVPLCFGFLSTGFEKNFYDVLVCIFVLHLVF